MKNEDLHGNVPDSAPVALVIIDMINDLEFPDAEDFLKPTLTAAGNIAALKQRMADADLPVIYVNDNFGRWRSNFDDLLNHCLTDDVRGKPIAELLRPTPEDYIVIKPKNSAFYSTTLETLLLYLRVKRLILTGISADSCILFTANDAYVRDLEVFVPADCVASAQERHKQDALTYMERVLKANIAPSTELELDKLLT